MKLLKFIPLICFLSCKCTQANGSRINLSHNRDLVGHDESELVHTILYKADGLHGKLSVENFTYYSLAAASNLTSHQSMRIYHYYDNHKEFELSGGPNVDASLCLSQLKDLLARLKLRNQPGSKSTDVNLEQLIETWGRRPSGMLLGNNVWPGMYNECRRLEIIPTASPNEPSAGTRYCWASMGHKGNWTNDEPYTIRVGTCLPEACDSRQYKNKFQLIETILKSISHGAGPLNKLHLNYLYCLPDEQSTMRAWWLVPRTMVFIGLITSWLLLIIFSTYTDKYPALSLRNNLRSLFTTRRSKEKRLVDLSVVDGMKVITAFAMITNHSLLYLAGGATNPYEIIPSNAHAFLFIWGAMTSAYSVDVFYTMTGILFAFLSFKGSRPTPLMTRPSLWLDLVGKRYLKIMFYYVLVVAYGKYITKYTGSGPFWDYGTATASIRRICEEETWLGTLTYGNVWRPPPYTCVPSGWYLADDFIFILVTPIFFQLLHWSPKLGQATLFGGILASYLSCASWLFNSEEDLRPGIYPSIQSIKFYLEIMFDYHIHPLYRIGPYFAGLLIGYQLGELERTKLVDKWQQKIWFKFLKAIGLPLTVVALLLTLLWPRIMEIVGVDRDRYLAHILMPTIVPFTRLGMGTVFGIVLMLASTGHTNKYLRDFLAASFWRPMSKVMLTAMLVNLAVIDYIATTNTGFVYVNSYTVISLCLTTIVVTYAVAIVIYLLVEAPMGSLMDGKLSAPPEPDEKLQIKGFKTSCGPLGAAQMMESGKLKTFQSFHSKL